MVLRDWCFFSGGYPPMKWLKNQYHDTKLWIRLAVPMMLVLLALLTLFSGILYGYAFKAVSNTLSDSVSISLIQAKSYMDMRLKNLLERMVYLRLDSSVDVTLTNYLLSQEPGEDWVTETEMTRVLSLYRASESLTSSLLLYTSKGIFKADGFSVDSEFDFAQSDLMKLLEEEAGSVVYAPAQRDTIFISHREVIPVMYRFKITGSDEECVIVINIDQNKLTQFLREILSGDGSDICIVDGDGNFITSGNSQACQELVGGDSLAQLQEGGAPMDLTLDGQRYLVAARNLSCAPWTLIYLQSEQQFLGELGWMRDLFVTTTVVAIALLLVAMIKVTGTITVPLKDLCAHIRDCKDSGSLTRFDYSYHDEIGTLVQVYNDMLTQIGSLLASQEIYIAQLKEEKQRLDVEQKLKRRAELQALQAQINPHFLYNTLDAIRWKAEKIGAADIVQMTTSLATLFRISLSRGEEIIPIEQETKHVLSYLQIQQQRYGDKLTYYFDIAPEAFQLYTVKLVLQPLVENAIYHGIKESDAPGEIAVSVRVEGDIVTMSVTDNGRGIPEDRLQVLQTGLDRGLSVNSDGYGIFNVNERLRLHFGQAYGLKLESQWGKGTTATLTMPRITEKEVKEFVPDSDC